MKEIFAKPAVGAIIEKIINNERYILLQERQKENGGRENGLLEIPAGKIREFENIFDALRREVSEETGLTVTEIDGEQDAVFTDVNGFRVMSFVPFFSSQNLRGGYSLMLQTFLCRAEGEPLKETDETRNIRWVSVKECKRMLDENPSAFFPMHINVLRKYLGQGLLL